MFTSRRLAKYVPALALIALAVPSSAFGQATRTWVSGVGDDANPCSRTAPCKTFAGAISKTAAGGEINVIDPGGFGGVTIGKSLTIKSYVEAGVLVSGTNGILINAGPADKVTIKGLDFTGLGTGLVGVKVIQAKSVHVIDSEIARFQTGVGVFPTAANTRVLVANTHIHDNLVGVLDAPGGVGGTSPITTLRNNLIADNGCGASVGAFGANPTTATNCGTVASGALNTSAQILAYHNTFYDNGTAVFARGALSLFSIGDNDIVANTVGLARLDSGLIKSFGNNMLTDNGSTAAPDGPNDALTKRHFKRHAKHIRF